MLYVLTTGSVVEALTPGAKIGGEVTRLYYLKNEMKAKTSDATNIIIIQKSISMSVMFSVCIISFLFLCKKISINLSLTFQIITTLCCFMLILILIGFLFFSKNISKLLEKSNKKFIVKINKYLKSYTNSTALLTKKEWLIQFTISIIVWLLFPLKMAILAYSFGIELNFLLVIAITMTSYMIASLPITPGGLGTFEVSMTSMFALVDVSTALSATITIIFRVITFWFVMLISVVYAFIYRRINKEVGGNIETENN